MKAMRVAAVAVLLSACAKPVPDEYYEPPLEMATVVFSLSDSPASKMTGITDASERAVARWAVFVFDSSSGQYVYRTSDSGDNLSVKLRIGRYYHAYAIVNYPITGTGSLVFSSIRSREDLEGKVAALSDQGIGELLMFGSLSFPLGEDAVDATQEKSIRVTRLVCRLDVRGIRTDFSTKPELAAKTFTLRHIYVTNAYRTSRYGADYLPGELSSLRSAWYNTMGWHRGEPADSGLDALLGQRNINTVVSASSPFTQTVSFYAFPNSTSALDDCHYTDSWQKRCTRIVLEATLGSETYYYQITAPAMERNYVYAASDIIIRGPGSKDPEDLLFDDDALEVTFSVNDQWDEGGETVL